MTLGRYKNRLLRELRDQQVRFAPRDKKLEQMARAEKLFYELESHQLYSYKFICFRITDFRPELHAEELILGEDARCDLLLFIDDLADSVILPPELVGEKIWTIEELCTRFHVSTKTLSRWRKLGLFSRRFFANGKKRVGFLDSTVNDFVNRDPERVQRGEQFRQLTNSERAEIIDRARDLSDSGARPTEVARLIAEKTGRSVETIRYTLKAFDETHDDHALFPNRNRPLDKESRRTVYHAFCCGQTVEELVKKFRRTKGSIYRVIGPFRVERILNMPLDYIDSPDFEEAERKGFETTILSPLSSLPSDKASKPRKTRNRVEESGGNEVGSDVFQEAVDSDVFQEMEEGAYFGDIPAYLARLDTIPLLTPEEETHLFRKMNYLKFKASQLRQSLDLEKPRATVMNRIESYHAQATDAKTAILSSNLRLVVSIAQKHVSPALSFFELIREGNLALLTSVEKFDYVRGNKFSTYATWVIMRNYARMIPNENTTP